MSDKPKETRRTRRGRFSRPVRLAPPLPLERYITCLTCGGYGVLPIITDPQAVASQNTCGWCDGQGATPLSKGDGRKLSTISPRLVAGCDFVKGDSAVLDLESGKVVLGVKSDEKATSIIVLGEASAERKRGQTMRIITHYPDQARVLEDAYENQRKFGLGTCSKCGGNGYHDIVFQDGSIERAQCGLCKGTGVQVRGTSALLMMNGKPIGEITNISIADMKKAGDLKLDPKGMIAIDYKAPLKPLSGKFEWSGTFDLKDEDSRKLREMLFLDPAPLKLDPKLFIAPLEITPPTMKVTPVTFVNQYQQNPPPKDESWIGGGTPLTPETIKEAFDIIEKLIEELKNK